MSINKKFWDWTADRYSRQAVVDEASYQKKLTLSQQYFDTESRILEFGCGTGSTAILHAPASGHIHATDISSKMLAIAETKARDKALTNITFEQTSLSDLNSTNDSWDAVLAMSILHLVDDKDADIQRVYQLLKPRGVFISSTICIGDGGIGLKLLATMFSWIPLLPAITVFSKQQLIDSLEAAGFTIEYDWQPGSNKAVFIVARKPD